MGLIKLHDVENKKASWIDTSNQYNIETISEVIRNKKYSINTFCKKNKIDIISINSNDGYVEPLVRFFNSRLHRH